MSGRHGNQHKKKNKPKDAHLPVRDNLLCQEHPDSHKESNVQEARKKPERLWFPIATVLISVLVFLVYLAQFYIMRNTMRMDQRPWVFQHTVSSPTTARTGEPIAVDVEMVNAGKTAALQATATIIIDKVNYFGNHVYGTTSSVYVRQFGIISQFVHTANYPPIIWKHKIPGGYTLIPTDDDVKDLNEGTSFIQIFGDIRYKDVFGLEHRTKFCEWKSLGLIPEHLDLTNVAECVKLNDVDRNY